MASYAAPAQDTANISVDSVARASQISQLKKIVSSCLTFPIADIKKIETDLYIVTLHCKESIIVAIEITSKETAVFTKQLQTRLDSALKGMKLIVPTAPRLVLPIVLTYMWNSPGWMNGEMAVYWFGLVNSTDKFDFRFWYLSPIYRSFGMEEFDRERMRNDPHH